jgi:AmmeMemoRadiSam system protein B/AmmeMemoRadiSam system protein A
MSQSIPRILMAAVALAGFVLCAWPQEERDVRAPAVAGQFYSSDAKHLRAGIQQFLRDAVTARVENPVALVVPHAGYAYAGQIIGDGYRQLQGLQPDVVVILGTNHTTAGFDGISIYPKGAFRTPLGDAVVDEGLASALLAGDPDCNSDRRVHAREHSIEVQVPFVQVVFPHAKILPAIVGTPDSERCARFGETLARRLKGRSAVIVASSDLSHYPSWEDANRTDHETLQAISSLDADAFSRKVQAIMSRPRPNLATCACGEAPIMSAMTAAKALGATKGIVVSYANSGDVLVGDRGRVVGYGAEVLAAAGESPAGALDPRAEVPSADVPLARAEQSSLLAFARKTLDRYLNTETVPLARGFSPRLQVPQAAFVTLKKHGELRGCIGHMAADTPLAQIVGAMSLEAAFNDPRFRPLSLYELGEVEIEISVLTPMKPISGPAEIKIGRDGVVLQKGTRSAVFLPQVAPEQGWGTPETLDNLCMKAGLERSCWKQGARLQVFQAEVFGEPDIK